MAEQLNVYTDLAGAGDTSLDSVPNMGLGTHEQISCCMFMFYTIFQCVEELEIRFSS